MKICVFLGSKSGNKPIFKSKILELGTWIAKNGHTLIFGGSKVGLMGELAVQVKSEGGKVIGIEPEMFDNNEVALKDVDEYIVVKTFSERKDMLMELSDVFIMFPGGMGTLEEFSQIASMKNMGVSDKKVFVYNIDGYYENLKQQLDIMSENDFYSKEKNEEIKFITNLNELNKFLN